MMAGMPVQLVSDGQFVSARTPLPTHSVNEHEIIAANVPANSLEFGSRILFHQPIAPTSFFGVALPRTAGRIESVQVHWSAYTIGFNPMPIFQEETGWITVHLWETDTAYDSTLPEPEGNMLAMFPLVLAMQSNPARYAVHYMLWGSTNAIPRVFVETPRRYRYLIVKFWSDAPSARGYSDMTDGLLQLSVGWSHRPLMLAKNITTP